MKNQLNFRTEGDGPAIVFLHGFCESINIWGNFLQDLSKNFKVILIDLPGFGNSSLSSLDLSVEDYASQVHECLLSQNISKYSLVGHSLGGYVALAIAELFPDSLIGLVMFHSSAFADTEEKKLSRNKTIDFVEKNGSAAFVKTLIPTLFFEGTREQFNSEVSQLLEDGSKIPAENIVTALKAMRDRKDRIAVLKKLKVPTLFIIGNEDAAIPLDTSLKQCYLPPSFEVMFLGETGHMGMIEKPDKTLKKIKDFAASLH